MAGHRADRNVELPIFSGGHRDCQSSVGIGIAEQQRARFVNGQLDVLESIKGVVEAGTHRRDRGAV